MFCKNCKKEIENDSKFCEHCGNAVEMIEKNVIIKKSMPLNDLKGKMWYRLLKVIYFFSFFIILFYYAFEVVYNEEDLIIFLPMLIIIYEIMRRSFYYVYFGTMRPEK
jgi:uncharacterized membrane protein YvbJ